MSVPDPDPARDLLRRVVLGELDADDARVRELFRERPELGRELSEMRTIAETLDHVVLSAPELAGELREEITDEDRARVRAALTPPRRSARPRLLAVLAVAAAALVAVAIGLRPWAEDPAPDGLLAHPLCLHPVDLVERFEPFSLDYAPTSGERFGFHVYDRATGALIAEELDAASAQWTPEPEELDSMRAAGALRWTFEVLSARGEHRLGGSAEAWLNAR